MRRKLQELGQALGGFVDQRESLLLIVGCNDVEMVYVLKLLEGMDDASPGDIYLTFAEPFTEAPAYVSAMMQALRDQMEVAKAALEAREAAPLSPLPALCDDDGAPPHTRLRAAIEHVSALVPAEGEHRVIWGFLPTKIADREGYARIAGDLVPWRGPEPWMRGLRVIAREDRMSPSLSPAMRKHKAPGVLLYEMDMSPAALNDALVKEAADRSLPVADRMQALAQLAGLDNAYRRYPQAIEKYGVLYSYHAAHKAPAMQAVALQGVGDALLHMGDPKGAKLKYQQGLALAMQTQALPVLLNLTYAIGDVSLKLAVYRDAEGYFGLAEQLAGKLMNPFAKADALEKQGVARDSSGDLAGAVLAWRGAEALCKTFAYHERHIAVLKRLIAAYKTMSKGDERRACEDELKAVTQAMKEATP